MSQSLKTQFCLVLLALTAGCSKPPAPEYSCGTNGCGNVCSMSQESCSEAQPCCPELKCRNAACGPVCLSLGNSCSATDPCCAGLNCSNGVCAPPCSTAGGSCTGLGTCCTGFSCDQGVCACLGLGNACGATGEACCAGLSCDGTGHCRAPCPVAVGACQPFGGACAADGGDCCAPGSCQKGQCSDPSSQLTCAQEGGPCLGGVDCCGSLASGSRLDCVAIADGGGICHLGQPGEPCDSTARHCAPGVACVFPSDAGTDDAGMETPGLCGLTRTNVACTLFTAGCSAGDSCNPNSSTNQGYDPCFYKVVGQNLGYRPQVLLCSGGLCSQPEEGDSCSGTCTQTVGDPRKTSCLSFYDGKKKCMPACGSDSDCRGSTFYDSNLANRQRVTNYCLNYGGGAACQPALCFVEGQTTAVGDPAVLYKPCKDKPNTICLPRYVSSNSTILGFCSPVSASPEATAGQACDPRAGREATRANCGPGAVCLGARCAAICDAAALGRGGTPTCGQDKTCISPQGLDLISDYQFGGCADPCDPFADLEHSGCVNYCGGAPAHCNWIIGDPVVGLPRGYCGAGMKVPVKVGQTCVEGAVDQCEPGAYCLGSSTSATRTCTRLCDPTVDGGTPDACAAGQTCTAFASFKRSGYCH